MNLVMVLAVFYFLKISYQIINMKYWCLFKSFYTQDTLIANFQK